VSPGCDDIVIGVQMTSRRAVGSFGSVLVSRPPCSTSSTGDKSTGVSSPSTTPGSRDRDSLIATDHDHKLGSIRPRDLPVRCMGKVAY